MPPIIRSEEHTSELQSHDNLVCRLLLEKKKQAIQEPTPAPHRLPAARRAARAQLAGHLVPTEPRVARSRNRERAAVSFFLMIGRPPRSTLFPYPTLFR